MNVMSTSQTGVKQVLYSRTTDGSFPVHVLTSGTFELVRPERCGGVKAYPTKRQLLIAITGHPKAYNWTFDRYFKLAKHQGTVSAYLGQPELTTLEWFTPSASPLPVLGGARRANVTVGKVTAAGLAMKVSETLPTSDVKLGIDLVNRSHEVAKLLYKGFGQWMRTSKYDPQEVLQEVYVSLLVRNKGKCPWDIRKSSFGHYVYMVCNGTLSNFHRKKKRIRECETTGTYAFDADGDWKLVDVASSNLPAPLAGDVERINSLEATDDLLDYMPEDSATHLARQVLPLLRDGYTRTDIARLLGVSRTLVMSAVIELQGWATKWHKTN